MLGAAASAWLCAAMPVFSQEAYYWSYAQHLDLSYFDHPPMVGWMIWLGTTLVGDGAQGVRLLTWLCGLGVSWLGLLLLRDFGVDRAGQRLWLVVALSAPVLLVARVLANPDPPLALFFTLTLLALWRARQGLLRWWLLAGFAAGLALLSKYTAAFLSVTGALLLLLDPRYRRQLRRPGPYLAVLMAALVFSPVVYWNWLHDFESFRFQTSGRFARGQFSLHWFAQLVGSQIGLLNPLLAILLPVAVLWHLRRVREDARALFLLAGGLPLLAYMGFQSFWIQVKPNWLVPTYVPLLLGLVVYWRETDLQARRPALARAVRWSLMAVLALVPLAPLVRLLPPGSGSSWHGWSTVAAHAERWEEMVDLEDGIEGNMFFFAADYRDAAQLDRNLKLHWMAEGAAHGERLALGETEPTLAQNVLGKAALQFDHWDAPERHLGQNAVFVLPRPQQRVLMVQEARRRFEQVECVEHLSIDTWGIHQSDFDIYVCRGYRGPKAKG